MLLKTFLLASTTLLFMGSCDSNPAQAEKSKTSVKSETPVQKTDLNSGEEAPAQFVNGITDANSQLVTGNMSLKGTTDGRVRQEWIHLYSTEGSETTLIDSAKFVDNAFDFGTDEYELGIYMLSLGKNGQNEMTIIMNPEEKQVELALVGARLSSGLNSKSSMENKGWLDYAKNELSINNAIRTLRKQANKSAMRAKYEQQIKGKEEQLKEKQIQTIQTYPGTFLAKVMTWKQHPYKADKNKYWNDIDWSDESLIHTPIVSDRIQTYMRSFSGGTFDGFLNAIDLTVQKAQSGGSPRVEAFTTLTLLEGFYSSGMDDVCQYILDSYVFGEDCGSDAKHYMENLALGVANLQIGKTPPDFTIKSWDNQSINLKKICKKNEYTLVMFWSSWCHKCEEEIPQLKKVYNLYHDQGFEVIGISVDTQRDDWVNAIQEREIPWPNVSQLRLWDSPVAKDYRVTATPAMFLLNKKGEIVSKPKRIMVDSGKDMSVNSFLKKNI